MATRDIDAKPIVNDDDDNESSLRMLQSLQRQVSIPFVCCVLLRSRAKQKNAYHSC
jgi:hypothetical protein